MKMKNLLVGTLLLTSSTGFASTDLPVGNNITRNVPHPLTIPADIAVDKSAPAAYGEMGNIRIRQLESENDQLNNLLRLQEAKIKLLETRIKDLEKK